MGRIRRGLAQQLAHDLALIADAVHGIAWRVAFCYGGIMLSDHWSSDGNPVCRIGLCRL
jgi:hypothetical protein